MKKQILFAAACIVLLFSCKPSSDRLPLIDNETFGGQLDGKTVELFTLKNANGLTAQITNYGGRVVNLFVPDRKGKFEDIVTGYATLDGYLKSNEIYYGTLIGRYGNRIAQGRFVLNDSTYVLATNDGPNHLHGGIKGFNNVVWDAIQQDDKTLLLSYISVDGEEGYPGNLLVNVTYELNDNNELKIQYWATTDKATHVNLTHHSFFNLKGAGNGDVNKHIMQINADYYTPVDETLIPTGEIAPVGGTPFDFRTPFEIGARVDQDNQQLKYGKGYDHNWVLKNEASDEIVFAAKVVEPTSGRTLEVYTNEPGIQFYGGNFLNGSDVGKYGKAYTHRGALCLETQHFPDTPNQQGFPSTVLVPGSEYYSVCTYKFGKE